MVNYCDLQFLERIMVARRSEISAEWKVRFAISIASVAIQAFTKLLFCFSDVLKATHCTFQEVDNIFLLAVGIAVYDEFFSCMCAELLCALDVFARHTSSRITFVALTIVGRSRGDVTSHQDIFKTFRFPESQDRWFFEDFAQLWVFCMVVQCLRTMLDKLLSAGWYVMTNGTLLFVFFSVNTTCFAKTMVNGRIVVAPLFQMIF